MFEVGVISPGTLSLVYILRVRGLLEDFGCFNVFLELFLIKTLFLFLLSEDYFYKNFSLYSTRYFIRKYVRKNNTNFI